MKRASLRQHARATVRRCGGQELVWAAGWTHRGRATIRRTRRATSVVATAVIPANSVGELAGSAQRAVMCSTGCAAAAGEALCAVRGIGGRAGAPVAASSAQRGHQGHDVRCSAAITEHARSSAGAPTAGGRCASTTDSAAQVLVGKHAAIRWDLGHSVAAILLRVMPGHTRRATFHAAARRFGALPAQPRPAVAAAVAPSETLADRTGLE